MSRELLQLQEQAVPLDTFVCNAAIIAYGKGNWYFLRRKHRFCRREDLMVCGAGWCGAFQKPRFTMGESFEHVR